MGCTYYTLVQATPRVLERAMFDFCPHCGQTTDQEQVVGSTLICSYCGQAIGLVEESNPLQETQEAALSAAAKWAVCGQLVDVKSAGTLVPHYAVGQKKVCPGSGKCA